uniref:Uncharacterized protein n=1 Tax=Zea mays TaxID=4577 RepID=C0PL71_MAIZE|nr:unknown [Zea mays]
MIPSPINQEPKGRRAVARTEQRVIPSWPSLSVSDDGAGVGILLAEDGGEPVGVGGDAVDALAHRRRVVAPVLPGEVLVPPRRRLPPRQRRRRVPDQVSLRLPLRGRGRRAVMMRLLTRRRRRFLALAAVAWPLPLRVLLLLPFLLLRRGRLGAEPDAARLPLLALASLWVWALWWLRLGAGGLWRRVFRLRGCLGLLGLGLGFGCTVVLLGLVPGRRLGSLWLWWCALLLRLWRRRRWGHVDGVVAGEGHRARHRPHVVGLRGLTAQGVIKVQLQPPFPPSLAPCT